MSKGSKVGAGLAAAAVAIGAGFAVGSGTHGTSTTTAVAPACSSSISSSNGQLCSKEPPAPSQSAEQQAAPLRAPSLLSGASNGRLPSSALAPATGCSRGLSKPAAAAWNHVAVRVHNHTGYWLQSNGDASCYRTYQQQVDLRNYWCGQGNCANAAVPGSSNHGLGLAVDGPPQTVSSIHQYGSRFFGQGSGTCSDAPWESWHIKYCGGYSGPDPGPYGNGSSGGHHHFNALARGDCGGRVKKLSTHLALLRRPTPKHPHYLAWKRRSHCYKKQVAFGVRKLQRDGHLGVDGVYGSHTHRYEVKRWNAHQHRK